MSRGLRDNEEARALFEKFGLLKDPERLEKYLVAGEVIVEVLDLFLTQLFGTESGSMGDSAVNRVALLESLRGILGDQKGAGAVSAAPVDKLDMATEDSSSRTGKSDKATEDSFALGDKLDMATEDLPARTGKSDKTTEDSSALVDKLDIATEDSSSRTGKSEKEDSSWKVIEELRLKVHDLEQRLEREMRNKASTGEVKALSQEVSRLREGGIRMEYQLGDIERQVAQAHLSLIDDVQSEIRKLESDILNMTGDPQQGIIASLTRNCGGNVHEEGLVEVTASGCRFGSLKNVVQLGTNSYFRSNDEPNSWICYDFKTRRVTPTSYMLISDDRHYPRSWVLEVSNDRSTWEVIDRRDDNEDLKEQYVARHFALNAPPSGLFRFVRFRLTAPNHSRYDIIDLTSFEIFGKFKSVNTGL